MTEQNDPKSISVGLVTGDHGAFIEKLTEGRYSEAGSVGCIAIVPDAAPEGRAALFLVTEHTTDDPAEVRVEVSAITLQTLMVSVSLALRAMREEGLLERERFGADFERYMGITHPPVPDPKIH